MFSPDQYSQVPETVWLPPDIRAMMEGAEEPSPLSSREVLKHQIDSLISRIEHVEYLVRHLRIEERLGLLEDQQASVVVSRRAGG
jgi:hypothetical protein